MAARTLVTVGTDGFRDYVDIPDGRKLNLGSVSVLKLVTTMVPSSALCRKALDIFLKEGHTTIPVVLSALEELLRPRRARWAGLGNAFIPTVSRQPSRGASMDQPKEQAQAVNSLIDEIESQIQLLAQTAQEHAQGSQSREQVEGILVSLRQMITELGKDPMGQSENDAFYFKLSALERVLTAVRQAGKAEPEDLRAFRMYTAGLEEDVVVKVGAVDEGVKEDLRLYMENDSTLMRQLEAFLMNVKRHMNRGDYDHNRAPALWLNWVDRGADAYVKEFPEEGRARVKFPTELRRALAKEFADDYKRKIDDGEYDMFFERAGLIKKDKGKVKKAGEEAVVEGPAQEVAKDVGVDNPYAGKDQSKNETYYKLAGEESPKVASEAEVKGPSEDVAQQTGVDNPYAGKDQSKNETYYKLAVSEVPVINEALAHSVMAKVEGALRLVEASTKQGTDVAKQDLNTITDKLTSLLQGNELGDPCLCTPLRELAGLADKVSTHFAS